MSNILDIQPAPLSKAAAESFTPQVLKKITSVSNDIGQVLKIFAGDKRHFLNGLLARGEK